MSAALRPSSPPAAFYQLRPKTLRASDASLRAGDGPDVERPNRQLNARRTYARRIENPIFATVLKEQRCSDTAIAVALGNATAGRCGAEVRAGTTPVTAGELALLFPLDVSGRTLIALLRERLGREMRSALHPEARANLRLMICNLDTIEELLRVHAESNPVP